MGVGDSLLSQPFVLRLGCCRTGACNIQVSWLAAIRTGAEQRHAADEHRKQSDTRPEPAPISTPNHSALPCHPMRFARQVTPCHHPVRKSFSLLAAPLRRLQRIGCGAQPVRGHCRLEPVSARLRLHPRGCCHVTFSCPRSASKGRMDRASTACASPSPCGCSCARCARPS